MTLISCKKETTKGCEHAFQEATCTQAKTCSKCGATEGEALGHTFQKATCQAPKHVQDAEQQKAQHYNIIMFLMHKVIIFVQFAKNILLIYLVKTTS